MILFLILLTLGCAKHATSNSLTEAEQLHQVAAGLAGGAALLDSFSSLYQGSEDLVLCAGSTGLVDALRSASEAVEGAAEGKEGGSARLPTLDLSLDECDPGWEIDSAADAADKIANLLVMVGVANTILGGYVDLGCRAETWLGASLEYASDVAAAIAAELADFDGHVYVEGVDVPIGDCA